MKHRFQIFACKFNLYRYIKDVHSDMPLHVALCHGQTPDVIAALLKAHPDAAKHASMNQCLPLHWALARDATLETVKLVGFGALFTTLICSLGSQNTLY